MTKSRSKQSVAQEEARALELTLDGMTAQGECTALVDGAPVLVVGGIPGEDVVAEVRRLRSGQLLGQVKEVRTPSPDRVVARCPYVGQCSGCQWQHISYERQLDLKRAALREHLQRVGGFPDPPVAPTIPSDQPWHYRNHARFTVRKGGQVGFVNRHTHRFVPIDYCHLLHPWMNHALALLQGRCGETTQLSLRYGAHTGKWLLQPTLQSPEVPLDSGQSHYRELLLGREFQIGAPSFFQVHTTQAERLVQVVKEQLQLTGQEVIVDAYSGVGAFAVLLAPHARSVIAIEEAAAAAEDFRVNAKGLANVRLILGKTEVVLYGLEPRPDAVVLDPPRSGCMPSAIEALLSLQSPRLVYVSCDPATLSRDLKTLCEDNIYRLVQVQPVDLFPQTAHIECVATLELAPRPVGAAEAPLVLASASPRRRTLLKLVAGPVAIDPARVPERDLRRPGESVAQVAERLALLKAQAVAQRRQRGVVVGGDTVVALDGQLLGKPKTPEEARAMLRRLRNRTHQVVTGVAVVEAATRAALTDHSVSAVTMRDYSDGEIESYISTGDPFDKAGAYAIQAPRFNPVQKLDGCYHNVVGLPLCVLAPLLQRMGVAWRKPPPEALPAQCRDPRNACPLAEA